MRFFRQKKDRLKTQEAPALTDLEAALCAVRGEDKPPAIAAPPEVLYPISSQFSSKPAPPSEEFKNATPGTYIPDQGIFLGKYTPRDENGVSLRKTFYVFAAPSDLTDINGNLTTFTYTQALNRVASLKDWHGYNGTSYLNHFDFYAALANETYDGGWVIPPRELLDGSGALVDPDNNDACRNTHAFFTLIVQRAVDSKNTDTSYWYWSCMEESNYSHKFWARNYSHDFGHFYGSGICQFNCRPVRFVEIKKP